ncbi:FLYWCH zinc finger domain-containing protein [Ditylenchus destructor]|uniref:FLYWCH zinc finger domain-containing protein n=1 Tax=Ditylenchus destructor TaxID=166010 RepID=A0AAD4QZB9_9BILA|nr:FLYWCH zinc finger domain-containing protein [Ditylenchus destructor]
MSDKLSSVPPGINYEVQYSQKLTPTLVFNGYHHHLNGSRNTMEGKVYYWRCVKRADIGVDKCAGTATIKENLNKQWQAIAGRTQHNHEPNVIQASIQTFQHELRSEALNGTKATREVVKDSVAQMPEYAKWGSTLHLIAASKLYKIVILTFSQLESGMPSWTVHNPSMQTGTSHSMEQELVYPSVGFQIEANHCDVVLDVEPQL